MARHSQSSQSELTTESLAIRAAVVGERAAGLVSIAGRLDASYNIGRVVWARIMSLGSNEDRTLILVAGGLSDADAAFTVLASAPAIDGRQHRWAGEEGAKKDELHIGWWMVGIRRRQRPRERWKTI